MWIQAGLSGGSSKVFPRFSQESLPRRLLYLPAGLSKRSRAPGRWSKASQGSQQLSGSSQQLLGSSWQPPDNSDSAQQLAGSSLAASGSSWTVPDSALLLLAVQRQLPSSSRQLPNNSRQPPADLGQFLAAPQQLPPARKLPTAPGNSWQLLSSSRQFESS